MPNDLKRKGSPEEQELERKRAELSARETLLADRELELATLNVKHFPMFAKLKRAY